VGDGHQAEIHTEGEGYPRRFDCFGAARAGRADHRRGGTSLLEVQAKQERVGVRSRRELPRLDDDCPVCGAASIARIGGGYARCAVCGLERLVEPLAEGVMENNRSRTRPARRPGPLLRAQLRVVASQFTPGMGLLDFGCGDGRYLYHARQRFDPDAPAYGVEQSSESVRVAVEVHGCNVVDDVRAVPAGRYLVTAWHVLEHLPPASAPSILRALRERLTADSLFVASVPNADSAQARLFGARWGCREVSHHYVQFSSDALDRVLAGAGFEAVQDRWIALYGAYGTAQGTANLVVRPHNQAHRWIKRGSDAGSAAHTAVSLGLAALSTPLTLAFAAYEGLVPRHRATITRVYRPV
jgi:hypothetical protein